MNFGIGLVLLPVCDSCSQSPLVGVQQMATVSFKHAGSRQSFQLHPSLNVVCNTLSRLRTWTCIDGLSLVILKLFFRLSVKRRFTAKPYGIAPSSFFIAAVLRLQNPIMVLRQNWTSPIGTKPVALTLHGFMLPCASDNPKPRSRKESRLTTIRHGGPCGLRIEMRSAEREKIACFSCPKRRGCMPQH